MSCRVRPAREKDHDQLCALWEELDRMHAAIQPRFFRWPPRPRPLGDLKRALEDKYREIFVALADSERGRRIVGAVQLHLYDISHQPMMLPGRRAYVEDLVVRESSRGQGVGSKLMEAAQHWAERHSAKQMVLTVWDGNQSALEFYERVGYRPINRVLVLDVD